MFQNIKPFLTIAAIAALALAAAGDASAHPRGGSWHSMRYYQPPSTSTQMPGRSTWAQPTNSAQPTPFLWQGVGIVNGTTHF